MANKNLFKKVAPVILSATVAFSGMPATAFAADFADTEVATEIEAAEANTEDADVDAVDEDAEADVDVEEAVEEDTDEDAADVEEETSEDALFSAGDEGVDVGDGESDELTGEYQYVYAGLTWAEYWASEGVYKATDTTSVDEDDIHGDPGDKGGFDAVTRATSNHGPYRASFQTITDMICDDGNTYGLDHFVGQFDKATNNITVVLTDGTEAVYNKAKKLTVGGKTVTVQKFIMKGIKYVPVAVKTEDYKAFKAKYKVVEAGTKFSYGSDVEGNVKSHSDLETAVDANTNGLKIATKNGDGFTFSARKTGNDSGIKGQELKTADVTPEVKTASGSFGEFLRVDLTGAGYGDLGGAMQAVKWEYYGSDSTYSGKPLITYGTKFAADNWMHSKLGIQLGLTKSVRCQLPEGYDGTGFWKVTVYALGYQDYTFDFEATYANIVGENDPNKLNTSALKEAIAKANALNKDEYTAASWASMEIEKEECEDMLATIAAAIEANKTVSLSDVSIKGQSNDLLDSIEKLEKLSIAVTPATAELTVGGTTKLAVDTNIAGNVAWTSSNENVATVAADGTVTAKAAGTATITATVQGKSATCTVTVKAAEQKPATPAQPTQPAQTPTQTQAPAQTIGITASVSQVYVGKKATIKVTKTQVTGTAKFTSSNKKVATVNSKGVITGKKAGKAVITVKVGKYIKKLTVNVKKPSFKLVKSSASIKKGQKVTIKSKAAPAAKVTYKTSNKKVATVNSKGVVTAKKKGTAKITVKCNGITKTFKVTVK